jgi:hypothetical protein
MSSLRRPDRAHRRAARAGSTLLSAVLALSAVLPGSLRAEPLAGTPEVRSAFVARVGGVFQLNAEIAYPANEETAAALRDGVTLSYDLDVSVTRGRRFWLDAQVVAVNLRRELSYHSVSERFVVVDPLDEDEPRSFVTLAEALEDIGRVQAWPILVAAQAPAGGSTVSVRASVRRGRLTGTLRVLMFWSDDWLLESERYSWSLPR